MEWINSLAWWEIVLYVLLAIYILGGVWHLIISRGNIILALIWPLWYLMGGVTL